MLFTGEYKHTIDAKQRLAVPAEVREHIAAESHPAVFYLAPGANGHLWLWPERTFRQLTQAMEASLLPGEDAMLFEELIFPQSRRLEVDTAGRVRIPEEMLQEFGLGQNVAILGVNNHLELRDAGEWERQRQENLSKRREIMLRATRALNRTASVSPSTPQPPIGGGEKARP